jgi:pimeloyl-ACP methyl ester carboxylesterase
MPEERDRLFNNVKTYIEYANLEKVNWDDVKDQPTKIPFVIQHGHTANHCFMSPVFEYFKERGYPVIMFDWRGHGWSQKQIGEKYEISLCVQDLLAVYTEFIKGEYGYEKFYLLGHSMGGFIAQSYATQYQDTLEKLILLSTSPVVATNRVIRWIGKAYMWWFSRCYEKAMNGKKKNHIKIGIEKFPQWEDPTLLPDKKASIEFLDDILYFDVRDALMGLQLPVFVCIGGNDTMVKGSKAIKDIVPHAQLEIIPEGVHNITLTAPEIVNPKFEAFLYQITPKSE